MHYPNFQTKMEEIRKALLAGDGTRLNKQEYQFVIALEEKRLFRELIMYTFVSFSVAAFFYFSLAEDIKSNDWAAAAQQQSFLFIYQN